MEKTFAVYILASRSRVLYIGITSELKQRVWKHRAKLVRGFTAKYNVTRLVYFGIFEDPTAAIAHEKRLKGWLRAKKVALIEAANPEWRDLYDEI
jgi:putative endonuclease